ncbi:Neuralized-like protein 4 [Eumeta japonica]|uniref:Neuralized-like protein 4 n=1 Tax=Eumeta variegata TaxID=151549 RepID=A0A4C2A6P9_EUMVA|nr:Neuralized-like protein 4 [Eumeta japonica]
MSESVSGHSSTSIPPLLHHTLSPFSSAHSHPQILPSKEACNALVILLGLQVSVSDDLYGRVAQASIVDNYLPPSYSPESPLSSESNATIYPEMCFHHVHGCNARLSRNRLTASRATFYSEFNDAVLFSSRPLRECEMFEVRIDKMVDGWIGSLEMGVTAMRPDDMDTYGGGAVAGTATALRGDTYILSGGAMMKDGECMRSCYRLNLDCLNVGSRVGMMWHADRSLHYYLDGMDQGKAWHVPHLNVYAVVDLYGRCTQVSIIQNEERAFNYNGCTNSENYLLSIPRMSPPQPYCFSEYCGNNVVLRMGYSVAARLNPDPNATLVFSAAHLAVDEIFEVNGNYVHYTQLGFPGERELRSIEPSFDWLRQNDRIGLKKTGDGRVLIYYNSEQLDAIFEKVPDKVYVVMQLYGRITSIQAISKLVNIGTSVPQPTALPNENDVSTKDEEIDNGIITINSPITEVTSKKIADIETEVCKQNNSLPFTFHSVHGKNVNLCSSDTVAIRKTGYSDGIVIASRPLQRGQSFVFRVDKVSNSWSGSIAAGVLAHIPTELPSSALSLDAPCWILTNDLVNDNGCVSKSASGFRLGRVKQGSVLALHFTDDGDLLLEVDGAITIVADIIKYTSVYPVIELYGSTLQVSTLLYFNVATDLSPPAFEADECDQLKADIEVDECAQEPQPGPSTLDGENVTFDHLTRWSSLQHIEENTRYFRQLKGNCTDSSETLKWDRYDNRETSASIHCDTNIKDNDRYPEAGRGVTRRRDHESDDVADRNDNSLAPNSEESSNDAQIQREESHNDMEPSNRKDLLDGSCEENVEPSICENVEGMKNSERATSSDQAQNAESIVSAASDVESYTLQNTIYFQNLIANAVHVRHHYQNESDTSISCAHMQNVYQFCKYILGWENFKQFWRKNDCYCIECRPRSTREEAGWAYLLVMEPFWQQNVGSHAYWHIGVDTLSKVQQSRDKGERPADLPNTPFQANAQTETWCYNEETYQGKLVLDVDISYVFATPGNLYCPESLEFDKLAGIWVYIRQAHTTATEKVSNDTKPSR